MNIISIILIWAVIIAIVAYVAKWKRNNPDKPIIAARELTESEMKSDDYNCVDDTQSGTGHPLGYY